MNRKLALAALALVAVVSARGCHPLPGDEDPRPGVEAPARLTVENQTVEDWWVYQDGTGAGKLLGEVRFASTRTWRLFTGAGPSRIALVSVSRRTEPPLVTMVFQPGSGCWRLVIDNAVRYGYHLPTVKKERCQ